MSIVIQNVSKRFGSFTALQDVSIKVPEGELVALLGPSGSGKTTLLRIVAGLEAADCGTVQFGTDDITNQNPRDRNIGFVFQHYALFRHMTVFENVAFGLRVRKWANADVQARVMELLSLVKLDILAQRYPSQLSGGQRQRVALARALASSPRVLLLDEPFGALDAKVRAELRQWLRRLHDEYPVTTLFVTHDQEEAFEVSDRVAVMNAGKVEQFDTPDAVFESPASAFVLDFLGNVNVFHGRVQDGKAHVGEIVFDCPGPENQTFGAAKVYVRPHDLDISVEPSEGASLQVRVTHLRPAGSVTRVVAVSIDGQKEIRVDLPIGRSRELAIRKGDVVFVHPRRAHVFAPDYAI